MPRILDSLWKILKGYRKAAGICPNTYGQPVVENAELPRGYRQKRGNVRKFSLTLQFYIYTLIKNQRHVIKFYKLSAAPLLIIFYQIIPHLARLKLV